MLNRLTHKWAIGLMLVALVAGWWFVGVIEERAEYKKANAELAQSLDYLVEQHNNTLTTLDKRDSEKTILVNKYRRASNELANMQKKYADLLNTVLPADVRGLLQSAYVQYGGKADSGTASK